MHAEIGSDDFLIRRADDELRVRSEHAKEFLKDSFRFVDVLQHFRCDELRNAVLPKWKVMRIANDEERRAHRIRLDLLQISERKIAGDNDSLAALRGIG